MKAHLRTVVNLPMTPKDLRAIADSMERFWAQALPGDDNTVKVWLGDGVEVRFKVDQERMHRDYGDYGQARTLKNGTT